MHIPKGEHTEWCRAYNCEGCVEDSFDAGYAAGLNAAEAAINKAPRTSNLMITLQDALAAICGLREEK